MTPVMTSARMARAASISSSVTSRGGATRTASGRTALTRRPRLERGGRHLLGQGLAELRGQEEPGTTHRDHAGQAGQSRPQPCTGPSGACTHVLGFHHGQGGPCGGQCQGLTAEGRAVIAGAERRRHLGPGPAGADRHAVAQCLRHGHHVGLEPLGLEGEPVAGAPETRLHLIEHQEGAPLGAQLLYGAQIVRARHVDAALALQRFHQDGGHRVDRLVERRGERGHVVVGHVGEALGQGQEGRVLLGLPGGRQRGQGPPVK